MDRITDSGAYETDFMEKKRLFYNHIWGPGKDNNCCNGNAGRYCREGKELKDAYSKAFEQREAIKKGKG